MQLRYRGVLYEYSPPQFFSPDSDYPWLQSETTLHLRVLRYRGAFYLRPIVCRLPGDSGMMLQSNAGTRAPAFSPKITIVQSGAIGYLNYRLYCLGWRNCSHPSFPRFSHLLLRLFLYYRRGFSDAAQFRKGID